MDRWKGRCLKTCGVLARSVAVGAILSCACSWAGTPHRLASDAVYHLYIDPLVEVKDFGVGYVEDGAADATVLFPERREDPGKFRMPADSVVALVRLRAKAIPLLIDCLSDTRITSAVFDGNMATTHMKVPVGFVCLDILMGVAPGKPAADPECDGD